jgi:hypothetical protein
MMRKALLLTAIAGVGVGFGLDFPHFQGFVKVSSEIQHFSSSSKRHQEVKNLKSEARVLLNDWGFRVGIKTADYDTHKRVKDAWITQYGIEVSKFWSNLNVALRVGVERSNIKQVDDGFWVGIRGQTNLKNGIEVKGDLVYYKPSSHYSDYEWEGKVELTKEFHGFEISPQLRLTYCKEKTKPFIELKVAKKFEVSKGIVKPYIKIGIGDAKKTSDGMFVYPDTQVYKSVLGAGLSWSYKRVSLNLFGEYQRVRDLDIDETIDTSSKTGRLTLVHDSYGGTFVGGSISISF